MIGGGGTAYGSFLFPSLPGSPSESADTSTFCCFYLYEIQTISNISQATTEKVEGLSLLMHKSFL